MCVCVKLYIFILRASSTLNGRDLDHAIKTAHRSSKFVSRVSARQPVVSQSSLTRMIRCDGVLTNVRNPADLHLQQQQQQLLLLILTTLHQVTSPLQPLVYINTHINKHIRQCTGYSRSNNPTVKQI